MSFDPILWSQLNGMKKSGGVSYETPAFPTVRWNSWETEGKDTCTMFDFTYVKVADISDVAMLFGATWSMSGKGFSETITEEFFVYFSPSKKSALAANFMFLCAEAAEFELAEPTSGQTVTITVPSPGFYCQVIPEDDDDGGEYVLTASSTVTKYIPGAVLPLVELATNLKVVGDAVALNAEENAKIIALNGSPFILSVSISKSPLKLLMQCLYIPGGMIMYQSGLLEGAIVSIISTDELTNEFVMYADMVDLTPASTE